MIKENLTIVIPCKNEEAYIGKTLEQISLQNGIDETRVIIADGGSADGTLSAINDFKENSNLKIEIIKGGSVSEGRNNGAFVCDTEFILFVDADTHFLEKDIIEKSLEAIKHNELVTCKIKCIVKDPRATVIFFIFNIVQKLMTESFSTGVFMLIRKDTFKKLGGFDLTLHQSEDYLLTRKIPKRRFLIIKRHVGQDNRRFKKMGYMGMLSMVVKNWINRHNEDHFRKNINYW